MTADGKREARFAVAALRARVSEAVFARGEAYHRGGQVELVAIDARRVLARVAGSDIYRTELTGRGVAVGGECSCPAFEDWGFCKHMVATALAANASPSETAPEAGGPAARIRAWLGTRPPGELVDMILQLGERDSALFRRLDVASAAAGGDDATLEARLRKAIDAATRVRGFIDYDEAGGWATGVEEALDLIADAASAGRGAVALRLAERAIERIEDAIESIDDSNGGCGALLHRARDIHLAAARACSPDPAPFARRLFEREMESDYDVFDGASAAYSDVLGESGLAEYRRLALEAWDALPPRPPGGPPEAPSAGETHYRRLRDILDGFAAGDRDVEARIALRAKDLSSSWKYLELAEFCLAQGRGEEALRRAEEALWVFEDDAPDERLVRFTAGLLADAGRAADAEAVLWRAFEKAPGLDLYRTLRTVGGEAARARAVTLLEDRIRGAAATRWSHPADLLVLAHEHDGAFDAAWAAVGAHGASTSVKEKLARSSEATHPRQAAEVYGARVEALAKAGGNRNYEEVASLVARMAALRSAAEQAAWVSELKARHRLKRNLMKLLG